MNFPRLLAAASFTRPDDTTQYSVGDLVAQSTTAGECAPLEFNCSPALTENSIAIQRARLRKSGAGVTAAAFRLHFFGGTDPVTGAGDNAAVDFDQAAGLPYSYAGFIDVTLVTALDGGAVGVADAGASPVIVPTRWDAAVGAQKLSVWIEARGTYTPEAEEVFTLDMFGYSCVAGGWNAS